MYYDRQKNVSRNRTHKKTTTCNYTAMAGISSFLTLNNRFDNVS